MDIWTPCVILETIHRNPSWHDFQSPKLSGFYKTEKEAVDELNRIIKLISQNLKNDTNLIKIEKGDYNRKDTAIEVSFYYTDRCITINGYIYHGHLK